MSRILSVHSTFRIWISSLCFLFEPLYERLTGVEEVVDAQETEEAAEPEAVQLEEAQHGARVENLRISRSVK